MYDSDHWQATPAKGSYVLYKYPAVIIITQVAMSMSMIAIIVITWIPD